jgi:endo-1,3-1,4-beta-glycanase ExoK
MMPSIKKTESKHTLRSIPLFVKKSRMHFIFLIVIIAWAFGGDKELLSSAELFTKEGVQYGRYEVRMRMVAADGVISSFFLWKDESEKDGASWSEIDIEVLGCSPTGFQSAIHCGTGGWSNLTHSETFHHLNKTLATQYNTYALEWTPDYICWKLNDSLIRKDTGEIVGKFRSVPMQVRFNIWPSLQPSWAGLFNPDAVPKHMYINGVKYYKYTPDKTPKFTRAWEDDFNMDTLDRRWKTGFWESPDKASTHFDKNVTVRNGAAILTLSKYEQCGFTGIIPQDNSGGTTFPKEFRRGR